MLYEGKFPEVIIPLILSNFLLLSNLGPPPLSDFSDSAHNNNPGP